MAKAKLIVEVALKDSFTKGMAQVSRFLVGEQGKIGAAFSRVTKSVFNLRNAIVGGLAAVMTKQLVSAYAQQEAAEQQLANAMKLTGTYTEAAEQRMHAFASRLQETSVVGDETALRMLGIATAMGQGEDRARKMVQAAADLSAATGKDLNASFQQLLKSTGGMAGELAELLPEVKALTAEQLKAGGATDLIARKFAGFAAAEAKTFGGQLTQIGNLWGDVKEKFGSFVAAIFQSGLGEWIKTTLVVLNEELAALSKNFRGSDQAKAWAALIIEGLMGVAKSAAVAADGFRLLMKPISIFQRAGLAMDLSDIETLTTGLGKAMGEAGARGSKFVDIQNKFALMGGPIAESLLKEALATNLTAEAAGVLHGKLSTLADDYREQIDGTSSTTTAVEELAKMQDKLDIAFAKIAERIAADTKKKEENKVVTDALAAANSEFANLWTEAIKKTQAAQKEANLAKLVEEEQQAVRASYENTRNAIPDLGPPVLYGELAEWQSYFDQIDTMSVAWAHAMQNTISQVAGGVANIVGDAVGDILRGEIRTTKELGKALQEMFTDLAISIVQDLIKISIQMAIMAGIKALAGTGGGTGGMGAGSFATGGIMRGGVEEWWPGERAATGGVFVGPRPVLLGDNPSRIEAAVPMPDGKRIPVDVRGPVGGGGITLNLNVQAMDGPSVVGTLSRPEAQQAITAAIVAAQRKNSRFRSAMKTR